MAVPSATPRADDRAHARRTRRALTALAAGVLLGWLGVYWDIAWHIDKGRDSFFTLPHDFIYAGMAIVLAGTAWALLRDRRRTPAHLRVGRFRLQLGLLVAAVGALLVLAFGPLDEAWHRVFGEDLTLWGPMHLAGLAGFALTALGGLTASVVEERLSPEGWSLARWHVLGFATALLGVAVLHLAEWEYGVPVFPMVLHPLLLAGLPAFALVLVARLDVLAWGATWTAIAFTAARGLLHLGLRGTEALGLAGVSKPVIPLLIPTGIAIDLLARRDASGTVLGAVGAATTLLVNVPVNRFDVAYPWAPRTILLGSLAGLALGALLGWAAGWIADALREPRQPAGGGPPEAGRGEVAS